MLKFVISGKGDMMTSFNITSYISEMLVDKTLSLSIVSYLNLKVMVHPNVLMSQSKFSAPKIITLRYE